MKIPANAPHVIQALMEMLGGLNGRIHATDGDFVYVVESDETSLRISVDHCSTMRAGAVALNGFDITGELVMRRASKLVSPYVRLVQRMDDALTRPPSSSLVPFDHALLAESAD